MTTTRPSARRTARTPATEPLRTPQARPAAHPASNPGAQPAAHPRRAVVAVQRVFGAENPNFYLLLGTTLFLVIFGLVMVLSSSSVEVGARTGDFFASFQRQGFYAILGVPLMLVASRVPAVFWKRAAWAALIGTSVLQLAVFIPGVGINYQGNQNWIHIGSFTAQPSELVKLSLALWLGWVLAAKQNLLGDWKHVFIPIGPVAAVAIGLVLLGKDLGTALILLSIVLGCLFYGGVRLRILGAAIGIVGFVVFLFTRFSSNRTNRIDAWLSGCTSKSDQLGTCWQTIHGWWGIASGGIFGSGLGESKVKWSWLPEADNDFIFAIIGDELGLIGAIVVLVLFVVLALSFIRIIRASDDPFVRVSTSGIMIWIIGQAFVNIAVVLGLLPVLGVPLPLISAGGSSLIASLVGIGIVLSYARHTPVKL
ncbi:putative lipid II flippase FtsW [Galbitalea soli]|uniref:Probable peptidoglycan glycosyltransferase FtsW n=1 Tax=Galbitalea soli TaxID=1268042 RepID=A0A7C9PLG2_9MICO|nr:putative lipid II flippase FtsW [Galbitalea soli]NEM90011.1 putative lipid II flippase FtsW [Galbitalea soli]NYJ30718.1 cell division protein FtsW [Galbitalea soli]